MQHGEDCHFIVGIDPIVYDEGKPPRNGPPKAFVCFHEGLRPAGDLVEDRFHAEEKFRPNPGRFSSYQRYAAAISASASGRIIISPLLP